MMTNGIERIQECLWANKTEGIKRTKVERPKLVSFTAGKKASGCADARSMTRNQAHLHVRVVSGY